MQITVPAFGKMEYGSCRQGAAWTATGTVPFCIGQSLNGVRKLRN